MKTTLLSILLISSLCISMFAQQANDSYMLNKKQKHNLRMEPRQHQRNEDNKSYKLRYGDREIPITTHDGQDPNERQLEIIEKTLTDDFLVNDDTIGGAIIQQIPSISMDGSGNFVIVWMDERNFNYDIYYQRYNSSGVKQGVNQKANDDAGTAEQWSPSISMDGSGNFVIVWSDGRNGMDIYYQRYNSSGVNQGVNQKANDDAGTAWQKYPSISMDGSGNFVIVWQDYRNGYDEDNPDIYFQRYNSSGVNQGVNQKANDDAGTAEQWYPSISMDGSGNFVIVWQDYRNVNWDIYYQRYNSSGVNQGVNQKASDDGGTAAQRYPSISMDGAGNFVIVWRDERKGNSDIYYQRYNSSGVNQGVNQKANDDAGTAYQYDPSISMDGSGNFVIVWADERNGDWDIYYQRYNSSGVKQGVNQKANDDAGTAEQWYHPSISMDGSGNFVIVWRDERNGNPDIYYQRYNSSGVNQGINQKANDDAGTANQERPSISMDGSGNFVIVWEDWRNGNGDIYYQRYNSSGVNQGVNEMANNDAGTEDQLDPSISMDGSGNFVIVWEDERNGNSDIYYQRYNSSGVNQGINQKANDDFGTEDERSPSISMDGSGNFVIVWEDWRNGNGDIYYQRYNSSGVKLGINQKANNDAGSAVQWSPSISMDGSGNFVIVWEDYRNGNYDIYYQRYNSSGVTQGLNQKANDDAGTAKQWFPSISMDGAGNFVIVWKDSRIGNAGIYYQRYNSSGVSQGVNQKANDDVGTTRQLYPSISMDVLGNFVIVWEDYRYGVSDIIGQRYFSGGAANGSNYHIVADGPYYGEEWPVVVANNSKIVFSWMDNRRSKGMDIYAKIVSWDWNGVIPVELKSFNASVLENNIELSWTTASEKNNHGFEIERSKDRISFIKIGFVEGKGTTTIAQNYTFTDKLLEVSGMKLYYRLKQIDYDGTFIYSDIAEVEIAPINFSLSQNYPNPFNPSTSIQYQVSSNSHVSLKVYDVLGNEVATLVDEYKPAGSYEVEFSARGGQESGNGNLASGIGYASGVYFYQLKAGEFIETKKMMLLR